MRDDYGLISHLMSFVRNMVPFSITLDSSNIVSKKYEQRVIPNELIIKVLMESGNLRAPTYNKKPILGIFPPRVQH